ncbi:hypothetical protein PCANC_23632, partial [Puccinia coronata f. sp. avenae]
NQGFRIHFAIIIYNPNMDTNLEHLHRGVEIAGVNPIFTPRGKTYAPPGGIQLHPVTPTITGEINHLPRGIQLNNLDVTNFYTLSDRPAMQQHSPIEI